MTFAHGVIVWQIVHLFVATLAWPTTTVVLALLFRDKISALLERVRSAKLPWGAELAFDKAARQAEEKALAREGAEGGKRRNVYGPTEELAGLNARLARHGLRTLSSNFALSYYFELAEKDPKLALAALRIDLESMIEDILAASAQDLPRRQMSLSQKADFLLKSGLVTPSQHAIFRDILPLANAAVHGKEPSIPSTNSLISAFGALLDDFAVWVTDNVPG